MSEKNRQIPTLADGTRTAKPAITLRLFLGHPSASLSMGILVLASITGCIPERVNPGGNGQSGALDFQIEEVSDSNTTLATGFEAELFVQRFDDQWRNCEFSKSVGLKPQSCTSLNNEPVSLIDVSCDGCNVTHDVDALGGVRFKISSDHDGPATVHVDVKSTSSSATWGDSFPLHFETATHMTVKRQMTDAGGMTYAVLPGASFSWCPILVSDGGDQLFAPAASFTTAIDGTVLQVDPPAQQQYAANPTACTAFHAAAPGVSTVTLQAHTVAQTETIKVVDPNLIASAKLYSLANDENLVVAAGDAPTFGKTPITGIEFTDFPQAMDLVSVLTMTDGTLALGGGGRYISSSEDLVSVVSGNGSDPEIARAHVSFSSVPEAVGTGAVTAIFGAVKVTIPFTVTSSMVGPDGGAP